MRINLGIIGYSNRSGAHELWARLPLGLHSGKKYHMLWLGNFYGVSFKYLLKTWDTHHGAWRTQQQRQYAPLWGEWEVV